MGPQLRWNFIWIVNGECGNTDDSRLWVTFLQLAVWTCFVYSIFIYKTEPFYKNVDAEVNQNFSKVRSSQLRLFQNNLGLRLFQIKITPSKTPSDQYKVWSTVKVFDLIYSLSFELYYVNVRKSLEPFQPQITKQCKRRGLSSKIRRSYKKKKSVLVLQGTV